MALVDSYLHATKLWSNAKCDELRLFILVVSFFKLQLSGLYVRDLHQNDIIKHLNLHQNDIN